MADLLSISRVPEFSLNITHAMGDGEPTLVIIDTSNTFTIEIGVAASVTNFGDSTVNDGEEFTLVEKNKLAGIEIAATIDQTNIEIRTAVGAAADSNIFTDLYLGVVIASAAKLDNIENFATIDQTDAEIRTAVEAAANSNVFTDSDHSKLDAIEGSATADQSNAEIRTAVEAAADSNVFTDADHTKLNAIEALAKDDQTDAEIRIAVEAATDSNVFTDADHSKLNAIEASATADQSDVEIATAYGNQVGQVSAGEMTGGTEIALRTFSPDNVENMIQIHATGSMSDAEVKTAYENNANTNEFDDAEQTKLAGIATAATIDQTAAEIRTAVEAATDSNVFTDADHTKLNAIEASATADQTDAQIRTAVEAATDSNVFTDADHSKLNAIEASATADQTDGEIETAYNNQVGKVSAGEITAGTEAAVRRYSPADVKSFVTTHSSGSQGWTINDQTGTSYTLVVADVQKLVRLTNAASIALTVPTNAAQAISIGSQIRIAESGAGTVTIDGAGVTLNTPDDLILGIQDEGALLIKVATDEWDIIKDIGGSGMSDAEVKTAYENNADTNAFDDAEQTKLAGIETAATADQTNAEIRAAVAAATDSNVFDDADVTKFDAIEALATADQTDAEIRAAVEAATDSNIFTDAENTKLGAIEASATADQTDAEIRTAVEAATDSNVFTDADHTKLDGISIPANINSQTGTTYTLVLGDAEDIVEMNNAASNVLTVPTNASVAFAIGTIISISMMGAGVTSITGASGVTINDVSAGSGAMTGQYVGVSLYKRATDTWVVQGAIGAVA